MRQHTHPLRTRSAYTLLELLLALAVISVLAGVTVPSALRMFADSKLSDAAEKVRNLVGQARLNAVNTGEQYQFRFEKDGRKCVLIPVEIPLVAAEQTASMTPATVPPPNVLGELPEGMRFELLAVDTGSATDATGPPLAPELFQGLPKAQDLVSLPWSAPIVFSADGSANDANWLVVDQRKQSIRIDVRGLTGAATIGAMAPFRDR
ncbi:MAG TPA: prepilin-type N-terminal cleavage/methylation domain-containing protein [Planctomycetaceae bacterium]|nr:prepilin-type N-terminal cleavage/methylation domain-containing protein [Planctomycetaceae bacterium]